MTGSSAVKPVPSELFLLASDALPLNHIKDNHGQQLYGCLRISLQATDAR